MSDVPDASTPLPAVTAVAEDCELAMFEVISLDEGLLVVATPFLLSVGEELPLQVSGIGRTTGRVVGHLQRDGRTLTELRLPAAPTSAS